MTDTRTGVVRRFSRENRWGFITPDSGGETVFVHYSRITAGRFQSLKAGQRVAFKVRHRERGCYAVNVRPIPPTADNQEGTP